MCHKHNAMHGICNCSSACRVHMAMHAMMSPQHHTVDVKQQLRCDGPASGRHLQASHHARVQSSWCYEYCDCYMAH